MDYLKLFSMLSADEDDMVIDAITIIRNDARDHALKGIDCVSRDILRSVKASLPKAGTVISHPTDIPGEWVPVINEHTGEAVLYRDFSDIVARPSGAGYIRKAFIKAIAPYAMGSLL